MIVYLVVNKINNKVYVGQTMQKLSARKNRHFSASANGSELPFHRAIRKYGKESFAWEIIYTADNLQDLNEAEEYLIAEYNARKKGYNVAYGGNNKDHPLEIREKISIKARGRKQSPETRKKMSEAHKGKKHTVEARANMSKAQKGKKHSVEHGKNIGEAKKGKNTGGKNPSFDHKIYAFRHAKFRLAFCTQSALREEFGVDPAGISMVIRGNRNHTNGWSLATPGYLQNLREGMGE